MPNTHKLAVMIECLDLTSLNEHDDEAAIAALCQKAQTPLGEVAAVCVYPAFVAFAKNQLKQTSIKVATVVNFPKGCDHLDWTLAEIKQAIAVDADEIDLVVPYKTFLETNDATHIRDFVASAKQACHGRTLKTILETGAFSEEQKIYDIACACIEGGADFIKTSTGKIAFGARMEAVDMMLKALFDMSQKGYVCGLKVSGGVRDIATATQYVDRMAAFLQKTPTKNTFRIGASKVLDDIIAHAMEDAPSA